uniref:Protein kinase domain-containing protein n=1 Tax=Bionectria ochroleuca TaxID=29856 RepID=A0A8H7TVP8_BIOOC
MSDLPPSRFISRLDMLGRGATAWAFKLDQDIALKYVRKGRLKEFQAEHEMYDLFEKHGSSPYIAHSFFRLPGLNFMQLMSSGLDQRIYSNQRRDARNIRCLEVLRLEPTPKVEQWAMELSGALAWLDSLGLVQGDLRPHNILLDVDDHLKLADFDCVAKFGSRNPGNPPPWARLVPRDGFGMYGTTSELFTFGSILYNLTHGCEPYEELDLDGNEVVELLRLMKFPELSQSVLDQVTYRCWHGEYESLADLASEMANLDGAKTAPRAALFDENYIAQMRDRCHQFLTGSLAGIEIAAVSSGEEECA